MPQKSKWRCCKHILKIIDHCLEEHLCRPRAVREAVAKRLLHGTLEEVLRNEINLHIKDLQHMGWVSTFEWEKVVYNRTSAYLCFQQTVKLTVIELFSIFFLYNGFKYHWSILLYTKYLLKNLFSSIQWIQVVPTRGTNISPPLIICWDYSSRFTIFSLVWGMHVFH